MKYSFKKKLAIVNEVLNGKSMNYAHKEYKIGMSTLQNWVLNYKLYGDDALRQSTSRRHITPQEKEQIVLEHVEKGVSLLRLSLRYRVTRSTITAWLRKLRREAGSLNDVKLQVKPIQEIMARPRKKSPEEMTELEKLQAENLRLRAENALLKKVKALVEARDARLKGTGPKPSAD